MKKTLFTVACAAFAGIAFADPVQALLVVQNHASEEFRKPLSNLATRLSAALSGDTFEVRIPDDAIGENQNRGVKGENMPLSSATRTR